MCATWQDYGIAFQGYWMRHSRSLEGSRLVAHAILSVNVKKGKKLPAPNKIWPLLTDASDDENEIYIPTQEELVRIAQSRLRTWQQTKD